jgi:hypothetical protein
MMQPGLEELERRAREIAREHNIEWGLLTRFGTVQKSWAYVLQDTSGYHFVTLDEDGSEFERRTTQNADDVLYWVITDAAHRAALGSFFPRPQDNGLSRLAWFERELEILGWISPEWQRRRKAELDEYLRTNP